MSSTIFDLIFPLRYSIGLFLIHKYILPQVRPKTLVERKYSSFDNISISLIHSIITAVLATVCIFNDVFNTSRLQDFNNPFATSVMKFSYAYFIYDLWDMLRTNHWNPMKMKEMTVHHFFLIVGAAACIYFQKYGAFAMLGLMMEVNSVFLHTRALIQYCNQRRSLAYKIMSIGNILTNIPFRLGVNYLIYSWYANGYPDFQFGYYGNLIIFGLNVKLLYQTFRSDFVKGTDLVYKVCWPLFEQNEIYLECLNCEMRYQTK